MTKAKTKDSRDNNLRRTEGYKEATDKMLLLLPQGYELEAYRRQDGDTQLSWYPREPKWNVHSVRESLMPHYQHAIALYAEAYGIPGKVHGSAHESRA